MSLLVLAGVIVTGAWTHLDTVAWAGLAAVGVTFLLDRRESSHRWRAKWPVFRPSFVPLLLSAIICALLLAHTALTVREEFGFGGDEGYHLSATRSFALYFMRAGPLLAVILAAFAVLYHRKFRYAATMAMVMLAAASYFLPEQAFFGRYPTGLYLIATPLNVAFEAARFPYPHSANHIVNVLSVPAWLFVLRPFVIGRWPDWPVVPVALLLYFQAPAFVYVSSALLEPWAFVFLLLAMEALVALEPRDRWIAVPLCAVATFFKDTAILFMPTMWLLACVEWSSAFAAVRRGRLPPIPRDAMWLGVAAIAPFAIYFAVRVGLQTERLYEPATAAAVWGDERLRIWIGNARAQLTLGGLVAVIAAAAFSARHGWAWIATAVAVALFFFVDAASIPYTGHGRFHAHSLIAVCGAVFAAVYAYRGSPRTLMAACAVLVVLQVPAVARTFLLDFRPDYERNAMEWRRSLIRLPIRTLAKKLETLPGDALRRVRVVAFDTDLISLQVAYPDLASRYELAGHAITSPAECACRDSGEAVVAAFEWPAHFDDTADARSAFVEKAAPCVAEIERTCRAFDIVRAADGRPVGGAGVGLR